MSNCLILITQSNSLIKKMYKFKNKENTKKYLYLFNVNLYLLSTVKIKLEFLFIQCYLIISDVGKDYIYDD